MKLVETILYRQWQNFKAKAKEYQSVENSDFADCQLRAAIETGIIIEPTNIDEMPVSEVMELYKAFTELYVKSITPDTKN